MKLLRLQFLHLVVGAVALPVLSRTSWALDYPTRSVRIVVGFPAGTSSDIVARLIAQWLSEQLGQQFIVENRPGAGTNVAAETVVRRRRRTATRLFGSRRPTPLMGRFTTR